MIYLHTMGCLYMSERYIYIRGATFFTWRLPLHKVPLNTMDLHLHTARLPLHTLGDMFIYNEVTSLPLHIIGLPDDMKQRVIM